MTTGTPRVRITTSAPVSTGSVVWQSRGQLYVSVVVKATFALVHDQAMELVEPAELFTAERYHRDNPSRSVRATSDLVPYLSRADVVLTGHACAPSGAPTSHVAVRLALFREAAVLDKTLHVYGDRKTGVPAPFDRIPLMYERAVGGVGWDENPMGVGFRAGGAPDPTAANIVHPRDPGLLAGFAPISRTWPARRRLLGKLDRKTLDKPVAAVPDGFDWAYFQAAPPDQQIDFLRGDEWLLLEGFHPDMPRITSRLPGARVTGQVSGIAPGAPPRGITFQADMLRIDADEQSCSVVWRGTVPVQDEAALEGLNFTVGIEIGGQAIEWSESQVEATIDDEPALATEADASDDDKTVAREDAPRAEPPRAAPPRASETRQPAPKAPPQVEEPEQPTVKLAARAPLADEARLPFTKAPPVETEQATAKLPVHAPQPEKTSLWTPELAAAMRKPPPGASFDGTFALSLDDQDRAAVKSAVPFRGPAPAAPAAPAPPAEKFQGTVALSLDEAEKAAHRPETPFGRPAAPRPRQIVAKPIPGAPWSPAAPPKPRAPTYAKPSVEQTTLTFDAEPEPGATALAPAPQPALAPAALAPAPAALAPAPAPQPPALGAPISQPAPDAATAPAPLPTAPRASTPPPRPTAPPPRTPTKLAPPLAPKPPPRPAAPPPRDVPQPAPSGAGNQSPIVAAARYQSPAAAGNQSPIAAAARNQSAATTTPGNQSAAATAAPRIGSRAQDSIPVVPAQSAFTVFTLPWQLKPRVDSLVVVVKATCDLVADGPAVLRTEADPPNGDRHDNGEPQRTLTYPTDFAVFKPRADVLLSGHAYAPGGSSPAAQLRFRFGHRKNGFDRRIAVFGERRWQKAGIRLAPTEPRPFKKVPLLFERAFGGAGFEKNPAGLGQAGDTLPQLEDPNHLVSAPGDTPDPACFAGVPSSWSARSSRMGTFDATWKKTRWPFFPDDFDWAYFQAAPAPQQLDHLQGDEPFELTGVHPSHPVISGNLPAIKPRCFVQKTPEAGGDLHEVVLRLDTVTFDPDAMKVSLVWRGLLDVQADDAPDVAELFVFEEPLAGPHLDRAAALAKYSALELPPTSPEVAALTAAAAASATAAAAPSANDTGPEHQLPAPAPIAALSPEESATRRAKVVALLATDASLDGLDLAGVDLTGLDFSGRSLANATLSRACLRTCKLAGANLAGAQLTDADLTLADLSKADLTQADLTRADLTEATLDGATLAAATFAEARCESARFIETTGKFASFIGAFLHRARFDRANLPSADFTRADLDGAILDAAVLPEIRLYDARGSNVSFKGASLDGARADGVTLQRSMLQRLHAPSSVWDKSTLDDSTFLGATLTDSGFVKATCRGTIFSGADLSASRLRRGIFTSASFLKANLMTASVEAADLENADLRGANLHGAETHRARLQGAKLDLAIVTQTKLAERT